MRLQNRRVHDVRAFLRDDTPYRSDSPGKMPSRDEPYLLLLKYGLLHADVTAIQASEDDIDSGVIQARKHLGERAFSPPSPEAVDDREDFYPPAHGLTVAGIEAMS
jgi:hypothetical protein